MSVSESSLKASAEKLPIYAYKEKFLRLLDENQTLVVVGETGSGKTTQIPQWCNEYLNKDNSRLRVACTQPRRIAAISVSTRVAKEMGVTLGQEVGYSVRFDTLTSSKTVLKYLTDGMLLREAMYDRVLSQYGVLVLNEVHKRTQSNDIPPAVLKLRGLLHSYGIIIIDEAHERTLQTEILLGIVKRALVERNKPDSNLPKLRVIVMSATIDVKLFKRYFFNSPVLVIRGRQYPVQNMFATVQQSDLLISTLTVVFQVHRTCDQGDILVFCSGQDEIKTLVSLCKQALKEAPDPMLNLLPLPLYASLPAKNQMKVFASENKLNSSSHKFLRRVIFSTNVAETSVTIPNIKYVIDTGMVKCRTYCSKTGLESLKITLISKAQASQRSGRAGRTSSGTSYRLYTRVQFDNMSDHLPPEIQRCNLDGVILQMISIGVTNIGSFDFLERPKEAQIQAALSHLLTLRAIKVISNHQEDQGEPSYKRARFNSDEGDLLEQEYELTRLGAKLNAFPLSPTMSRVLIAADSLGCLEEALTIISLLYVENIIHVLPNKSDRAEQVIKKFYSNEGDLIMLLRIYKAFRKVVNLNRENLKAWCKEHFIHTKNLKLACSVRKQLMNLCKSLNMKMTSCGQDTTTIRRAFAHGLFNNIAQMSNGKYKSKDSTDVTIHPSSCLFRTRPECIMYVELVETNKCYMRNCTLIDLGWIREVTSTDQRK